jgi:hypothetical protein
MEDCRNKMENDRHYFEVYKDVHLYAYIWVPLTKVKRCVRLEILYRTSGDIYYFVLLLLHKPSQGNDDNLTYTPQCGGGESMCCTCYQQSAIAHGIVDSIDDVTLTFQDMCNNGTSAQCRNYFVVLTLHGYATHAIYDNDYLRRYMYQDYIYHHNAGSIEVVQMLMLQDLEQLFRRS